MPRLPINAVGTIFAVCFFAVLIALSQALSKFKSRRVFKRSTNVARLPLQRPPRRFGLSWLTWQTVLLVFGAFDYLRQGWNPSSVGLTSGVSPILAFGFGAFCYSIFVLCYSYGFRAIRLAKILQSPDLLRTMASFWPRGCVNKMLAFWAVVLNPVTEEFLFRGILVHQLSLITGSVAIPLVVGLSAMLAVHFYQGWRAIPGLILVYIFVVALLFSPMGLAGAIGFHLVADLDPLFTFKRNIRIYRNQCREDSRNRRIQLAAQKSFD
jgi:membrane protease YdiL (CAAX protease family)